MYNFFVILLVLVFTNTALTQTLAAQQNERQKMILKVNQKIEPGIIFEFCKKCDKEIQQGIKSNKPVSAIRYFSFTTKTKMYLDYRWFVADTGLSKEWFGKIHKLLDYMYKTRSYMQAVESNGRTKTEKYKKSVEYFDLAYERLGKLMMKPVKAPDRVIQKEKVEKDMWQRRMRKKYNIKESWYSIF